MTGIEYFNIKKKDDNIISCIKAIPDHPKGIVIAIHGFTSSKESSTYRLLLDRLPAAGFGMVGIDLPGHGTGESAKETLRVPGAIDSIKATERHVLREYPGYEIYYFGSSFGAYLIGLYISTREHVGRKAFWRSAAVNMPELFNKENPTEAETQQLENLETKGFFDAEMEGNKPVRVTKEFYNDLLQNNLFEIFDANHFGQHQISMAHGREDSVISPEVAERFAKRFRIPITWFPGEGHSLSNNSSTPDQVVDLAISMFSTTL
jgi:hypothetical protein